MVGLPLGDDQVTGAQQRVRLALGPRGVELGAPALEGAKDIQTFEDVVAAGCWHASLIAVDEAAWKAPRGPRSEHRPDRPQPLLSRPHERVLRALVGGLVGDGEAQVRA